MILSLVLLIILVCICVCCKRTRHQKEMPIFPEHIDEQASICDGWEFESTNTDRLSIVISQPGTPFLINNELFSFNIPENSTMETEV